MRNVHPVAVSALILAAMLAAGAAYMNHVSQRVLEPDEEIAKVAYSTNLKIDLALCFTTLAVAALLKFAKPEENKMA